MVNIAIVTLGCLCTTQALELVQANLPWARLVTHRRTIQVSRREVAEPKLPQ